MYNAKALHDIDDQLNSVHYCKEDFKNKFGYCIEHVALKSDQRKNRYI